MEEATPVPYDMHLRRGQRKLYILPSRIPQSTVPSTKMSTMNYYIEGIDRVGKNGLVVVQFGNLVFFNYNETIMQSVSFMVFLSMAPGRYRLCMR